ncbi:MAG: hypothetical protein MI867_23530 [Pseudomonadales bacterium]|nr:hypothetical protein [Pseudomonadales bacterium]
MVDCIGASAFISEEIENKLCSISTRLGLDKKVVLGETDTSGNMEGLYIKVENDDEVLGRYKCIRGRFLDIIKGASGHWKNRFPIENQLSAKRN